MVSVEVIPRPRRVCNYSVYRALLGYLCTCIFRGLLLQAHFTFHHTVNFWDLFVFGSFSFIDPNPDGY